MNFFYTICTVLAIVYAIGWIGGILSFVMGIIQKNKEATKKIKQLNPFYTFMIFMKKSDYSEMRKRQIATILSIFAIIGALTWAIPYTSFGTEDLTSHFKKKDFDTYYYVHLYPNNAKSKLYKLIAHVEYSNNTIWVDKIYFPDGGYIYIEIQDEDFIINEKIRVLDNQDKEWELEILNEKPSQDEINEWIN